MISLNYFYETLEKQNREYSETEGNGYPLFFVRKNNSRDVHIGGREYMKTKGKRVLTRILFFLFLAAGWYLMQYFCAYVVLSGSMEPEIPTGSVVVVDGRKKEWNPGDVITYRRGNMVVTHRIVEKSEEGYCTKGDANAEEDAGIVLEKQVIGNVIVALPWLGFGIIWLRQRGTLFFLAVGAVMLFTIRQLWHGRKIMQENKL